MTTYLCKSCSFGSLRMPFVNCRQFMYLVISLLVLRAGCGIWLYQFLIIAYHFTFHYICIVCAKHQTASVSAVVQVDFLMYALSKHKHNPYLIGKAKFTKLSFCQKLMFWHQTSSHKCSVCLYCVSKVSDCVSKSCGYMHYLCINKMH